MSQVGAKSLRTHGFLGCFVSKCMCAPPGRPATFMCIFISLKQAYMLNESTSNPVLPPNLDLRLPFQVIVCRPAVIMLFLLRVSHRFLSEVLSQQICSTTTTSRPTASDKDPPRPFKCGGQTMAQMTG